MVALFLLGAVILVAWFAVKAVAGLVGFLIMIAVWMFIGYLVGQLVRGKGYGPVGDALLGLGGGIVGSIVLRLVNVSFGDVWIISNIIVGVIGALILVFGVRLLGNEDFAR